MTAADAYAHIARYITGALPNPGWEKALLRIGRTEGSHQYDGICLVEGGMFIDLPYNDSDYKDLIKAVNALYQVTTQGGNNEWNLLYYTMMPGGAFEVDFVLDEDTVTGLGYLAQTRRMPDAQRRQNYRALQNQLAEARSLVLYRNISQRLPALAATMSPTWQQITLHIEQWRGGFFKFKGLVQANNPEEADEFNVTQDWGLVKEFYELSTNVYLPSWNLATWTLKPDGTYSIVFDWDNQRNPRIPPNTIFPYTHEGRWQEPA